MAKKFLNVHDMVMRLDKTICFYEGKPVVCKYMEHTNDEIIYIKYLSRLRDKWKEFNYTDEDFCVGFKQLGNVTINNTVYHATRAPGRSQKWGITQGSVLFRYRGDITYNDQIFLSKQFGDTLEGKYPSLDCLLLMLSLLMTTLIVSVPSIGTSMSIETLPLVRLNVITKGILL